MDLSRHQKIIVLSGLAIILGCVGLLSLQRLARESREQAYLPAPTLTSGVPPRSLAVHVAGAVRQPGLYWLPEGSRVSDAVGLAGGFLPGADTGSINLAAPVEDGRQIVVALKAEAPPQTPSPVIVKAAAPPVVPATPPEPLVPAAAVRPSAAATAAAPPVVYPLSLNQATVVQLESLPTIGPKLARRIVDYRTTHGGFQSIEELTAVQGIDEGRMSTLRRYLRL